MSRESDRPRNLCTVCPVTAVCPCPLAERAYRRGYEGMSECEMFDVVGKVVRVAREHANLGGPSHSGS